MKPQITPMQMLTNLKHCSAMFLNLHNEDKAPPALKKQLLPKKRTAIYMFLVIGLAFPSFLFAQTPQGSLSANGFFCGTGAGMLTWTSSSGNGPFTVIYNDGSANRTAINVISATPFAVFTTSVTATTTYTLVSVTGADAMSRTSGFTNGSATITVKPKPNALASPLNQTICNGAEINVITLSSNVNGASLSWTRDNLTGITGNNGLAGFNGTGNISGSFSSALAAPQTIGLQATASLDGCTGSPVNITVTVNPSPSVDVLSDQYICNKRLTNPVNFTGSASVYSWTNSNTAIGLAASGTGDIPSFTATNNGNNPITGTITVTPVLTNVTPGCAGTNRSFNITVNPTATLTSPVTESVCSGAPLNYSPATNAKNIVTIFNWSRAAVAGVSNAAGSGTGNITETLVNTTNATVNVPYVYTLVAGGCTNPTNYSVVVAVKPAPGVNVSPSGVQTICSAATINTVTISSPGNFAGTIFSWSRTNGLLADGNIQGMPGSGTGNQISGSLINTTTVLDTTLFTAVATNNGCSSEKSFLVKVLPPIILNKLLDSQVSELAFCGLAKQLTIATNVPKGGTGNFTYQWQVSTPGNNNYVDITGATDSVLVYYTNQGGYYRRIAYSGGCTDISNEKFVKGTGGNTSSIVGLCTGGSGVDISVLASYKDAIYTLQRNKTGTWENVPGRQPITGTGNTITFENLSSIATYRVSVSAGINCTQLVAGTVIIDASTLPGAPTSTSVTDPVICSGNSTNIIAYITGASVNWYTVPAGGSPINITPIPSGTNYSVSPDTTTTYYAKSINPNGGCKSSNRTAIKVTVNPTPVMTSADAATICTGGTVSIPLTDNVNAGTTFTWQATDNPGTTGESTTVQTADILSNTIVNNTNASAVIDYKVIPTISATGCVGISQHVLVTVDPAPIISAQTASVCSGSPFNLVPTGISVPTSPATVYTWALPPTGGGFTGGASGSGTSINGLLSNTGANAVQATYTVVPTGGACTGEPFTATITINPTPSIADQQAVGACDGSFSLPPFTGINRVPAGTVYSWAEPIGSNIANLGSGLNQPVVSGRIVNTTSPVVPVTATYTVTPTSAPGLGSCDGGTFKVVATITSSLAIYSAYWNGSENIDWCNAANWKCNILPDFDKDAIIPAGTPHQPAISSSCLAFAKDVDVQGNATLDLQAGGGLTIYGAVVNKDESRYMLNGKITFGGVDQEVPAFVYNGLAISGGGKKTLLGATKVDGSLILNNGIVIGSNANMLTISATGNASAGSDNSYIEGPLTRLTNSTGSYNFPVGFNGKIRRAYVIPVSNASSSYKVLYHNAVPAFNAVLPPGLQAIQMNEYWDIILNSGVDAVVAMDYKNPNALPANAATTDWSNNLNPCQACNVAVVVKDPNNNWSFTGGPAATGFSPEQTRSWQSDGKVESRLLLGKFGQFTFGYADATILAIKLLYFNGSLQGNNAMLEWKYAPGSDVVSTELQHSLDGRGFEKLATLPATADPGYSYKHLNLRQGAHFYRLLIKDKSGVQVYSHTVLVVAGKNITVIKELRPTMVNSGTYAGIHSAIGQSLNTLIIDAAGRTVSRQKGNLLSGENNFRINTQTLARGVYSIRLQTDDGAIATFKFVKE